MNTDKCPCPPGARFHALNCPVTPGVQQDALHARCRNLVWTEAGYLRCRHDNFHYGEVQCAPAADENVDHSEIGTVEYGIQIEADGTLAVMDRVFADSVMRRLGDDAELFRR
jgi:hypothetical protein